jgi:hypothetical protein
MKKPQVGQTTDHDLLIRVDERIKSISEKIEEIDNKLSNSYVTKAEFRPVKLITYGAASTILLSVFGALVLLVVQ